MRISSLFEVEESYSKEKIPIYKCQLGVAQQTVVGRESLKITLVVFVVDTISLHTDFFHSYHQRPSQSRFQSVHRLDVRFTSDIGLTDLRSDVFDEKFSLKVIWKEGT